MSPHSTMKHLLVSVIAMTLITCACNGCARKPTEKAVEHTVRKVTPETAPGSATPPSDAKEAFERSLVTMLGRLDEDIRELKAKLGSLKDAAAAGLAEKLTEVDEKRKEAEARLDEVRRSAGDAWQHLEVEATRAWKELDQAIQSARKEF